jgi:exodeoxyribonuclease VII large subunit
VIVSDLFSLPFEEDRTSAVDERVPRPAERRVLSVAELTAAIRGVLETGLGDVWVEGEISNCRAWNTGHVYFTLKDDTAQIKAVMFRMAVRYLRFTPEDGLHVIARGRVGVYEPKGEYQIVCEHLEPRGLGARQLAFEQLKKRLHAEGLFEPARKRSLPALPRRVGIVTSLDGAAIRDILKVLRRRSPNSSVLIRPTRVQGEGAGDDVARAIAAIGRVRGVDVIIVGRGGGSVEDLWTFNEEVVARAIAAAPVPVVSAVGHEVDVTIADFVADLRAPTPSAAAEMVVAATDEFCARIDRLASRMRVVARCRLHRRGREYHGLRQRLEARDPRRRLASIRARLAGADGRMSGAADRTRHRADARFRALAGRLENLSPLAVLGRGYAVCWTGDRSAIVRSADSVGPGDAVRVTLSRGELACRVEETHGSRRSPREEH